METKFKAGGKVYDVSNTLTDILAIMQKKQEMNPRYEEIESLIEKTSQPVVAE